MIESTIKQVGDGCYPDGDFMAKASWICGLSPSWILKGTGSSYPVWIVDDENGAEKIDLLLSEEDHTIDVITAPDGRFCVQISIPIRWEVLGELIHSHSTELIAGDLGTAVQKRLRKAKSTHRVNKVQVSTAEYDRISGGWGRLAC
ncbi:hypothetical protein [Sedimenticola selenatireducens]|uniref:hypothetical protein n=1 Tax=Sedimenticola selenatireducens TaxID=191960 RepID=UPI002AAB4687|nr:hypothetical protein [Sedimenticola selenatireducens]